MNRATLFCAAMLAALIAAGAVAQDAPPREQPGRPPGDSPEGAAAGQDAIKLFDKDGDGQLTGEELNRARAIVQALRRAMADRWDDGALPRDGGQPRPPRDGDQPRAQRDGDQPRPPRDRGLRARGGPEGQGAPEAQAQAEGRRPPRPRAAPEDDADRPARPARQDAEPRRMFDEFDADSSGTLSRDEFQKLMSSMRERGGPVGPPEGPQFGGRDGVGPPEPGAGGPRAPREGRGEGRAEGRRVGPRPAGPPPRREGGPGPAFDGPPGPPPEASGDEPQGPPQRRLRQRDGERRRPPREVDVERDEADADRAPEAESDAAV